LVGPCLAHGMLLHAACGSRRPCMDVCASFCMWRGGAVDGTRISSGRGSVGADACLDGPAMRGPWNIALAFGDCTLCPMCTRSVTLCCVHKSSSVIRQGQRGDTDRLLLLAGVRCHARRDTPHALTPLPGSPRSPRSPPGALPLVGRRSAAHPHECGMEVPHGHGAHGARTFSRAPRRPGPLSPAHTLTLFSIRRRRTALSTTLAQGSTTLS